MDYNSYLGELLQEFLKEGYSSGLLDVKNQSALKGKTTRIINGFTNLLNLMDEKDETKREEQFQMAMNEYSDILETIEEFGNPDLYDDLSEEQMHHLEKMVTTLVHMKEIIQSEDFPMLTNSYIQGNVSFQDAVHNQNVGTIDVTSVKIDSVGGQLNKRLPMSMRDGQGNEIKGFATKLVKSDCVKKFHGFCEKYNIPEFQKEKIINHIKTASAYRCIEDYKNKAHSNREVVFIDSMLGKGVTKTLLENNPSVKGKDLFNDLYSWAKEYEKVELYFRAGYLNLPFDEEVNVTSRNVAMSYIATALGQPDLLAKSTVVKIKDGSSVSDAVFMENAKGLSYMSALQGSLLQQCDTESTENPDLKRQVADLQIIDYICQNGDRHSENITYQVEMVDGKAMITGVQGIDNDMSFGENEIVKKDNGSFACNNGVSFNNLLVITEGMEKTLRNIDKKTLVTNLKALGVGERAAQDAMDRVDKLLARIDKDKPFFEKARTGRLMSGHIRVVKDDEWQFYKNEELTSQGMRNERNLFYTVAYVSDFIQSDLDAIRSKQMDAPKGEIKFGKVKKVDVLKDGVPAALNKVAKKVSKSDPFWITSSDAFVEAQEQLDHLREMVQERPENPDKEWRRNYMTEINKLIDKSQAYLDFKKTPTNRRERIRVQAMTELNNVAKTIQKQAIRENALAEAMTRELTQSKSVSEKAKERIEQSIRETSAFENILENAEDKDEVQFSPSDMKSTIQEMIQHEKEMNPSVETVKTVVSEKSLDEINVEQVKSL